MNRYLETCDSDTILWKTPTVGFVFHWTNNIRSSCDHLIEPITRFGSPIFRTQTHGYFFFKFYTKSIGLAAGKNASILFTFSLSDYDNLLQLPLPKCTHSGIRDQFEPVNTWRPTIHTNDKKPAFKRPTISCKDGVFTVIITYAITHTSEQN